ncbi:pirin family protein [Pseudomonas sp. RA_15y_Pfl2_54]|uniref:pirin family protein n=1 Tax=Pseudomonas sp. RA_15y_Pfl2_54 TaxID=3088704 RepID=UPI0030DC335F
MTLSILKIGHAGEPQYRGTNHFARLVISPENAVENSPFLLMAEDWFAPPAGFPTHPHRGMETVTFVVDGQLLHEDHTGASGTLSAGAVEFMTAGAGVFHSEMPGPHGVHSLQLWLNLPASLKSTPARYSDLDQANAPVYREAGVEARVYAGSLGDVHMPYGSTWPITLIDLKLDAGITFDLPVPAEQRVFVYLLAGDALLGIEEQQVATGHVAWTSIPPADQLSTLRVSARTSLRLLMYASCIINEPIVLGGPFVMNTEQEITQAFMDINSGHFVKS